MWHAIALTPGWLDDTPASGTTQRQAPWDRSTSVVGQRHYAVEEVFPHSAVSDPTQHLCMPVGKGTVTALRVLMDAQRFFSGPQRIHSGRG